MSSIYIEFWYDGELHIIKRKGFESEEQFHEICVDMIETGIYESAIYRKYSIPSHYQEVISNTFRQSPGSLYLAKLIIEGEAIPHPDFWRHQAGKAVNHKLRWKKILSENISISEVKEPYIEYNKQYEDRKNEK